jgi:hypothetical protein
MNLLRETLVSDAASFNIGAEQEAKSKAISTILGGTIRLHQGCMATNV